MKPAPFKYYAPTTIDEALAHLAQHGYDAKVLAGGQSLIPTMNFRLNQPSILVDLNNIPDLFYIRPGDDGGVRVGAMTRHSQVEHSELVAQRAPLVSEAIPRVGHAQIRNRGTFGGSLAHADPSAELTAVCVALGARFRTRNQARERWVAAQDFFIGPFTTVLELDELLVEIDLPAMPPRSGWSFKEITRRHNDFALVGVGTTVRLDDAGRCAQARLVFLSVGEGPVQALQAAQALQGQVPTPALIQAAAETAASSDVDPSNDIHASADYRRQLVQVLARRTLTQAFERARG